MRSHVWMAVGLFVGLLLGLVAAATQSPVLLSFAAWVRPIGTLFLNLLQMVVIPLVAAALFLGVASLGNVRQVGRLGARTLVFFFGITIAAIIIGMVVASLLLPLAPITPEQQTALRAAALQDSSFVHRAAEQIPSGARFLVELVPSNPVKAAVDGNLLPLIVFVTLFAIIAIVDFLGSFQTAARHPGWIVISFVAHLIFGWRLVVARRASAAQRAGDLERFRALRNPPVSN